MTSSLVQRYEKAQKSCALFHLEDWAVFRLIGPDTRDYLQRISTADIKSCADDQGIQTLFLQRDGRLVADCALVCESEETFYLTCPVACREGLAEQLDRFLFSENVSISDVSEQYYVAHITGPAQTEFAAAIQNIGAKNNIESQIAKVTFAPSDDRTVVLLRREDFQQIRALIYTELDNLGGIHGGQDLFETLLIESGCPMFGKDTSTKTIPLEANQKTAISFTKGCFPGQEIVARINNLGHPANTLVGLVLPETTENFIGRQLKAGEKTVGRITSTCYSPELKAPLALGFVKWNFREAGQQFEIAGEGNFKTVVVQLPLPGYNSQ